MLANKNIVITGGSGFIACDLAERLALQGANLLCISRRNPVLPRYNARCDYEQIDLRDAQKLERAISLFRPKTVYHLASRPDGKENYSHSIDSVEDNLVGTINLLEAFKKCSSAKVLVYGDSVKVYGNSSAPYNIESLQSPNSSYAITKLAAWSFCELYARNKWFNVVSVRPTLIYGPNQPLNLIRFVIESILNQQTEINLMGGEQTRSPLYIKDAIDAYIHAAKVAEKENLKTMLVSGKTELNVYNIALLIAKLMDSDIKVIKRSDEMRETEICRSYVDLQDTYKHFGWRPSVALKDGLRETIRYYTNNEASDVDPAKAALR